VDFFVTLSLSKRVPVALQQTFPEFIEGLRVMLRSTGSPENGSFRIKTIYEKERSKWLKYAFMDGEDREQ